MGEVTRAKDQDTPSTEAAQASKQASEELSKQIMNDALFVGWWLLLVVAPRAIDEGLGQPTDGGGRARGGNRDGSRRFMRPDVKKRQVQSSSRSWSVVVRCPAYSISSAVAALRHLL